MEPALGSALSLEPASDSLSLSLCPPPLFLSLSQKKKLLVEVLICIYMISVPDINSL